MTMRWKLLGKKKENSYACTLLVFIRNLLGDDSLLKVSVATSGAKLQTAAVKASYLFQVLFKPDCPLDNKMKVQIYDAYTESTRRLKQNDHSLGNPVPMDDGTVDWDGLPFLAYVTARHIYRESPPRNIINIISEMRPWISELQVFRRMALLFVMVHKGEFGISM